MYAETLDRERLMESCEDDAELARDVVEDFLCAAPQVLTRIAAALASGDAAGVRLEAHSLKGSSQTIGGERTAAASARVEAAARRGELADVPPLLGTVQAEFALLISALTEFLVAS